MSGSFYLDVIRKDPRMTSAKRIDDLALLEPVLRGMVPHILYDLTARGFLARVWETYRSKFRQKVLFTKGTSKRNIVGVHHFGLAVDIVLLVGGQPSWDREQPYGRDGYLALGEIARAHGLCWGPDLGLHEAVHMQRCAPEDQKRLFAEEWYPDESYVARAA